MKMPEEILEEFLEDDQDVHWICHENCVFRNSDEGTLCDNPEVPGNVILETQGDYPDCEYYSGKQPILSHRFDSLLTYHVVGSQRGNSNKM